MRIHLLCRIFVVVASHAASAQDKPDFSEEWILVSPTKADANVAQAITVHESFIRESVQGTPLSVPVIALAVDRRYTGKAIASSESYTVGTITGIVSGTVHGEKHQIRVSTTWNSSQRQTQGKSVCGMNVCQIGKSRVRWPS